MLNSVLKVKALVGAFNQEKALVGAFSVIVKTVVEPMEHFTVRHAGRRPSHPARRQIPLDPEDGRERGGPGPRGEPRVPEQQSGLLRHVLLRQERHHRLELHHFDTFGKPL